MKMKRRSSRLFVLGLASITVAAACGRKNKGNESPAPGEKAEGSDIAVSGTLNVASSADLALASTVDVAALKVNCVTFALPPVAGSGKVEGSGKFSVTLAAAKKAFGCFVVDADDSVLATLVFKNSNTNSSASKVSLEGDTDMGAIVLDPAKGTAEVDVASFETKIQKSNVSTAAAFDFTGTWKFSKLEDANLPKGYSHICDRQEGDRRGDCEGPADGMAIYFKREVAKAFRPDDACKAAAAAYVKGAGPMPATCGGTTQPEDAYVASIWESSAAFEGCGGKLGFTDAETKALGYMDLQGSNVLGRFTFAPGFVDGWKHPQAKTMWEIGNCEEVNVNGRRVWRCKGDVGYCANNDNDNWSGCTGDVSRNTPADWTSTGESGYSDGVESICTDASGQRVKLSGEDWSQVRWNEQKPGAAGKCEQAAGWPAGYAECTGYPKFEKTGEYLTCKNVHGTFKDGGVALPNNRTIKSTPLATAGTFCKDIATSTEAGKIAQLRCYANGIQDMRDVLRDKCYIRPDFDWSAKTADAFQPRISNMTPDGMFLRERANYFGPDEVNFRQTEDRSDFIDTGSGGVTCRVFEEVDITVRKIADTKASIAFSVQSRNLSTDKDACNNAYSSGRGNVKKFMGYMTKQ